jgi:hypothetical protein
MRWAQPLLQLKERHRLSCVAELRCDSGTGPVTSDVAPPTGERHPGLFTKGRNQRLVEMVYSDLGEANEKEKIDEFSGLRVGELHTLRAYLLPRRNSLSVTPYFRETNTCTSSPIPLPRNLAPSKSGLRHMELERLASPILCACDLEHSRCLGTWLEFWRIFARPLRDHYSVSICY